MCKHCAPILGPRARAHNEDECPLKQASHCSLCGINGHFTKTCHRTPSVPDLQEIPNTPLGPPKQIFMMADNNQGYVEYLKLHSQPQSTLRERNRALVEDHLKKREYILMNPPNPQKIKLK